MRKKKNVEMEGTADRNKKKGEMKRAGHEVPV
jgi:hypothetical protein